MGDAAAEGVIAEGWLLKSPVHPKLGGFMQKARQRWFVVRRTPLKVLKVEYYQDDSLDKKKGELTVSGGTRVPYRDRYTSLLTIPVLQIQHCNINRMAVALVPSF